MKAGEGEMSPAAVAPHSRRLIPLCVRSHRVPSKPLGRVGQPSRQRGQGNRRRPPTASVRRLRRRAAPRRTSGMLVVVRSARCVRSLTFTLPS